MCGCVGVWVDEWLGWAGLVGLSLNQTLEFPKMPLRVVNTHGFKVKRVVPEVKERSWNQSLIGQVTQPSRVRSQCLGVLPISIYRPTPTLPKPTVMRQNQDIKYHYHYNYEGLKSLANHSPLPGATAVQVAWDWVLLAVSLIPLLLCFTYSYMVPHSGL